MRIVSFHIDGFGVFNNVDCGPLSAGLNIFYGKNEAGKSTCLDFFRVMLTGYPEKSRNTRSCLPLRGGQPGGSLLLECEDGGREVRLYRSPPEFGGLRLHDASGGAVPSACLERLFAGIDARSYRRIYGFGLEELEKWDKASEESIRNALYGATFGPGLNSPASVANQLEKLMADLYKPKGSQQALMQACFEVERLHEETEALQAENKGYNEIIESLQKAEAGLRDIAEQNKALEKSRRQLERRLVLWQQWEQWRLLLARYESMEEEDEYFPEDGAARLARVSADCDNCARALAASQEKVRQLERRAAELAPDQAYIDILIPLRRLAERKSGYRAATLKLVSLREAERNAREALDSCLAQLGPDWDCKRIRATDRSLFAREDMEKQAAVMSEARLAHQAALGNLDSCNREVERWRETIERCGQALLELPKAEALLTEEERDNLRRDMARLEESRRLAPGRQRAFETAETNFARAMEQANIFGAATDDAVRSLLSHLLNGQDKAMRVAAEMQGLLARADECARKVNDAEREIESIKKKTEGMRAAARAGGATRAQLEAKASALRNLRGVAASIKAEEERQDELETRIAREKNPSGARNWVFISFSFVFFAASALIFCAHWFWGINELRFGEGMAMPVNLWAAYAALVCGVALFAGGFSSQGPERKRRRQELARLLSRSEACSMRLADLLGQSQRLCQEAGVENPDPVSLDATEMLLEREKERMFQEERTKDTLDALQQELGMAQAKLGAAQKEAQAADLAVQECRRRWHDLMQGFRLEHVPSPESAGAMFARVEAAALARENVESARAELDALWEDLHLLEQGILEVPAIQERLKDAPEPLSMEEAVRLTLEGCREADALRDRRIRTEADLAGAKAELERAAARQLETSANLDSKSMELEQARGAWIKCTAGLGLAGDMDPETVREAYKCMDNCLAAEDRLNICVRELEQAEAEIAAFEQPLKKLLVNLQGADDSEDYLAALDNLLAGAEEQSRAAERRDRLQDELEALRDSCAADQAALDAARDAEKCLLAQGRAENADQFLRKVALREERRSLKGRLDELGQGFANACGSMPLEDFLKEFEASDRATQEEELAEINRSLEENAARERDLSEQSGALKQSSEHLATSDKLADLRQKEEQLRFDIADMARNWSRLAVARSLLKTGAEAFEKERQPEIIKEASRIFTAISGGQWAGISLNLENSTLRMLPSSGEPVAPHNLSRGAQEQAYLALRLAYIRHRARDHETLPVIMDDILVNFDPERARRAASAFAGLARDYPQQFLYFTCHPHTVEMLRDEFGETRVYEVRDGQIMAA